MKKATFLLICLCGIFVYSQEKDFNQFSIEASYGLNSPFSPSDNSGFDVSSFSGFKHFDIGGRYMFNQFYGVKLNFAYDKFQQENSSQFFVTYNRIGAEAVFNLSQIFNIFLTPGRNIQIQSHTGLGITFAQPSSIKNKEKIGNLLIGITPQFKLSERIALTTDFTYSFIFKQHFNYAGDLIDPDYNSVTGSFINLSFGLQFYLGEKGHHADWH